MKSVLVTGVSSGIGLGTVRVLIGRGVRVFGSVRRQIDADRLQAELGEMFLPLIFDITDHEAVQRAAVQVRAALGGQRLSGLVNNAGVAVPAPLAAQPIADFRHQLEVNLVGPVIVTQAFLPLLGTDASLSGPPGRIVNISSIGARLSPPFLAAYAASKAGLEALSDSLRRELIPYGIDVLVVAPGSVNTGIADKSDDEVNHWAADPVYATPVRRMSNNMKQGNQAGYGPEQLGEAIWTALQTPRPRPVVRSAPGPEPLLARVMMGVLPKRVLDKVLSRGVGLKRQ